MRCAAFLLLGATLFGQTEHKPKAEDYPVHTQVAVLGKTVQVGTEFMVHSFSSGEESYIAPDYLVVEVALYPAKGETLSVSLSQFQLRINGKKPLPAQLPQLVASSLDHPEWQDHPRLEAGAGMGGVGVGIGQPRPPSVPEMPPLPGTPKPPPQVPKDNPGGLDPRPRVKPQELVVQTALPPGDYQKPVSGFLYFGYHGKASSIKTLELLYEDAAIKLR